MAFIIYIDAKGNEVNRKEKGRGRPPRGEVMPNGDIKVNLSADITIPKKTVVTPSISSDSEEIVEEVPETIIPTESGNVIKKRKVMRASPCVTPYTLISAFLLGKNDVLETEKEITVSRIYVRRKLGGILETVIRYDAVIDRIHLDLEKNIVRGWYLPSSTTASRLSMRRGKGEALDEEDRQRERDRGDMFVDPADFEIEGCLILEDKNENS